MEDLLRKKAFYSSFFLFSINNSTKILLTVKFSQEKISFPVAKGIKGSSSNGFIQQMLILKFALKMLSK